VSSKLRQWSYKDIRKIFLCLFDAISPHFKSFVGHLGDASDIMIMNLFFLIDTGENIARTSAENNKRMKGAAHE
jgi:hypothetical protein